MEFESKALKKRAKSFFWASLFFSKRERKDIEILYSFCRYIDDIGDSNKLSYFKARKQLDKIIKDLKKKKSNDQYIINFIKLAIKYNIKISIPIKLIEGVTEDLKEVRLKNKTELLNYSFKVAGTVGLMMSAIMNVKQKKQFIHAIELGVAMQITNISRDVKEDLDRNRLYVPKNILNFNLNNFIELKSNISKQREFSKGIIKMLDLSDELYKNSYSGILNLPFKYKVPILIASNLYQQIGFKIRKNPEEIWKKRIFVSNPKKIQITIKSIITCIIYFFYKKNNDSFNHSSINTIIKSYKDDI